MPAAVGGAQRVRGGEVYNAANVRVRLILRRRPRWLIWPPEGWREGGAHYMLIFSKTLIFGLGAGAG